jgi:hypothetical protein
MAKRPRGKLWLSLALLAIPCLAWGQKHTVIPLVPAPDWQLMSSQSMGVEAVRQWGGDPAIEREYGVKTIAVRKYHLGDQLAQAVVEEAADPSSAYGLLTYYRTPGMQTPEGMKLTFVDGQGALMARARFFIRVPRPEGSQVSDKDFRSLLVAVGGTPPGPRDLARLPAGLPTKGLVPGTEKYLLGPDAARHVLPNFRVDLLGFSQGAEVRLGDYMTGQVRATVVVVSYPTPQIARARFGALQSFLGVNRARGAESIYGRRSGSYVLLVLGTGSSAAADKLMDQFRVVSDVSWNEPYPGGKPFALQVVELILANLLLIFILVGSSIGGGVAFFLVRRALVKCFPQWEWADPDRENIIQLRLR